MIELSNISKSYGFKELFTNLNFRLNASNKLGFVGRNGSGKSTLFKLILGEEHQDDGKISIPKGYKIGSLKQHLVFTEKTVREEGALALSEDDQYSVYKVEKILFGLGFTLEDLDKDPLSFSGGYQIRINLAKLLVTEPNLLLLDEPTNYLDILSLRWLSAFLKTFPGEVIIITHDRNFMDSVTTHTMGLVRRNLEIIPGNTHKFYAQLASNDEHFEKQKIAQDRKRKELEEFVAKNKARASTAAQAQSKQKELDKMEDFGALKNESNLDFDFNYKDTPAKVLLDIKDLKFGYSSDNVLFKDISFTLEKGETLGIIGKNGKGKSTLLNVIAGELDHLSGKIAYNSSSTFGHFGQTNIDHLNPKNTIMEEVYVGNPRLAESSIRGISASMMFTGDDIKKKIGVLSGGEKSRVMLGKILAKDVNILFLDEPTNHLDMQSIDSLTKAIENFDGSCIVVTHSEELLRRVCDRLIIFSKGGADYFDGGYDDFLERIGWEEEDVEVKVKKTPRINKKDAKKLRTSLLSERNKLRAPINKKIDALEREIEKIEDVIESEKHELIQASNAADNRKVSDVSKLIADQEIIVEQKFSELEILQLEVDEITEEYDKKLLNL